MWGTHWAGGIVSTANPGYTVDELAFQLKDSGATAIATQMAMLDVAVQAAKRVGIPDERIILIGDEKDKSGKYKHFTSIRNMAGTNRYRRVRRDAAKDLAFLPYRSGQLPDCTSITERTNLHTIYSSGTTGRPKGVMLSHTNLAINTLMNVATEGKHLDWRKDVLIGVLPFYHIYGIAILHRVRSIHHSQID